MPPELTRPGVYIKEAASAVRTITGVATSITAFIGSARRGPLDTSPASPVRVRSYPEFVRVFGGLSRLHPMSYAVDQFFQNGGAEALIVRVANGRTTITDAQVSHPSLRAGKAGLWALEKADLFNLLCVPPFSLESGGDIGAQTRSAAAAYARQRRAFYIVDPLADWNRPSDLTAAATGLESTAWGLAPSENAALYFPRLRCPDPLQEGRLAGFAPSGAIAGLCARTDAQRGVWKAPAGGQATLAGVSELTVALTHGQNGLLNALGVNCLRAFPRLGRVAWGARTLYGADALASEWKYVPVRRLALFIEESLLRGTRWVVFEPNDQPLWAQIRLDLGAFMQHLWRQGAFQGRSAREAYFVKCDSETTTRNDIARGVVNMVVAFAPLKPAEFVVITLQQKAGQIST